MFPFWLPDSQEVEKIELPPKALDRPELGRVSEPDRRRLFLSVTADDAAEEAMELEWRRPGLVAARRLAVEVEREVV